MLNFKIQLFYLQLYLRPLLYLCVFPNMHGFTLNAKCGILILNKLLHLH